jgi:type IV secretory pathway VirJ component
MAGDFENLSHAVQKQYELPRYHVPVAVGYSSGATLIYALLAQAPVGTLAGGLSLGFSPDLIVGSTLCKGEDLHYSTGEKGDSSSIPRRRCGHRGSRCRARSTRS